MKQAILANAILSIALISDHVIWLKFIQNNILSCLLGSHFIKPLQISKSLSSSKQQNVAHEIIIIQLLQQIVLKLIHTTYQISN